MIGLRSGLCGPGPAPGGARLPDAMVVRPVIRPVEGNPPGLRKTGRSAIGGIYSGGAIAGVLAGATESEAQKRPSV